MKNNKTDEEELRRKGRVTEEVYGDKRCVK